MSRKKLHYSAAGVVLAGALVSLALAGAGPRSDRVTASFGLARTTSSVEQTCPGEDGPYIDLRQSHEGSILSTDARLSGTLTTHSFFFVNQGSGLGTGHGTLKITDSATGNLKLEGSFQGAVEGNRFKGLATGNVVGQSGSILVANISIVFLPDGSSVGDLGAPVPAVPADLAVIQVGSCPSGSGS